MALHSVQILPYTVIRRHRLLPVPGELLVRAGQKVDPAESIARAIIPMRHYVVDVFRALEAATPAAAEKMIPYKPGHRLEKQDIIAETGGVFSRVVRTPGPGRIVSISGGRVLIEAESQQISLRAGLRGRVSEVISDYGVIIEFHGAMIQGVWGNGSTGCGVLSVDSASLDGELLPESLGLTARGLVVLAGYCSSAAIFESAASDGVAGMILGSLPSRLIPLAKAQPYPVLVLGGFGVFGLDVASKNMLTACADQEISINAAQWDKFKGYRPEAYVPGSGESVNYADVRGVSGGQMVRVNSGVFCGKIGLIEQTLPGLATLPSGLRSSAAKVNFQGKSLEVIPLANLELIQTNAEQADLAGEGDE